MGRGEFGAGSNAERKSGAMPRGSREQCREESREPGAMPRGESGATPRGESGAMPREPSLFGVA